MSGIVGCCRTLNYLSPLRPFRCNPPTRHRSLRHLSSPDPSGVLTNNTGRSPAGGTTQRPPPPRLTIGIHIAHQQLLYALPTRLCLGIRYSAYNVNIPNELSYRVNYMKMLLYPTQIAQLSISLDEYSCCNIVLRQQFVVQLYRFTTLH